MRLIRVLLFPGVGGCFWEGRFFLAHFWPGILFAKDYFYGNLLYCARYWRRCRHGLIWEGVFVKGASNLGAVMLGALVPGDFGSG